MTNQNSINQIFMRALLGLQFIPRHLSAATASIGAVVQTVGTGQHDLTSGGTFTDIADHVYTIIITATGTFKWQVDGGSFTTGVTITGSAQTLANGVQVTFGHTTGYTINDAFTITVTAGVALASAVALGNIAINSVGSGATLAIYDGSSSSGTLLYKALTASWTAGQLIQLGYALQNEAGLYVALYASSTYPDLIIGYN